jgi:hypothetical protein
LHVHGERESIVTAVHGIHTYKRECTSSQACPIDRFSPAMNAPIYTIDQRSSGQDVRTYA